MNIQDAVVKNEINVLQVVEIVWGNVRKLYLLHGYGLTLQRQMADGTRRCCPTRLRKLLFVVRMTMITMAKTSDHQFIYMPVLFPDEMVQLACARLMQLGCIVNP